MALVVLGFAMCWHTQAQQGLLALRLPLAIWSYMPPALVMRIVW
jgi:hypothetical protein